MSGDAGKRNLALVPPRESPQVAGDDQKPPTNVVPLSTAPAALVDQERDYWDLWSPLAYANTMLNQDTLAGFVLLCQVSARAAEMWRIAKEEGFSLLTPLGRKAHPLLTQYRGLMQRQEQLLARYGLASLGMKAQAAPPEEDDERAKLRELLAIGRR